MKRFLKIFGLLIVVVVAGIAAAYPTLKRHEESVQCGDYMASIGCAARLWAEDHDGYLPEDLLSMSNELVTPKILICPGDHTRQAAASWATFTTNDSSFEIVTLRLPDGDTNEVFLRCKIHGHLGYADGTVFDGTRRRRKVLW